MSQPANQWDDQTEYIGSRDTAYRHPRATKVEITDSAASIATTSLFDYEVAFSTDEGTLGLGYLILGQTPVPLGNLITLPDLEGVTFTGLAAGDALVWDGSQWVNESVPGIGGHQHDATDITSGVLADIHLPLTQSGKTFTGALTLNTSGSPNAYLRDDCFDKPSATATIFNFCNSGAGAIDIQVDGNKVWHAGNHGTGSTLDADKLDGLHASAFLQNINSEVLQDLNNVVISAVSPGEVLQWDGTRWINRTLAESGISSATHNHDAEYSDIAHNHDADYAPLAHTHPSTEITDFDEAVDDQVAGLLQAGDGIGLEYDDGLGTLTVRSETQDTDQYLGVSSTPVVVASLDISTYRSMKCIIQATRGSNYQVCEILGFHDGTDFHLVEYAVIHSTASTWMQYTAEIVGSNAILKAASIAGATNVRIHLHLIAI